ncbi:MAG: arylsulfotransferase family protein, partial [Planctomycetota bacterium]
RSSRPSTRKPSHFFGDEPKIKWAAQGVTTAQHDPDFLKGGKLIVFDNHHVARYNSPRTTCSRIVIYDLAAMGPVWSYSSPDFFTDFAGSQQRLPNGNVLISETRAGTIFEVTPEGRTVWKYRSVNQADRMLGAGQFIGWVRWPERFPRDYFTEEFQAELDNE